MPDTQQKLKSYTLSQKVQGNPLVADSWSTFPKPGELIEVVENRELTRNDRVIYNMLLANAWDKIAERGQVHKIAKSQLKGSHKGNERLEDSINRLMGTIVTVVLKVDGAPMRNKVQLLGPNREELTKDGYIHYTFADELINLLENSNIYARLNAQVLHCLQSKYAIKLYEMIERRRNLDFKQSDNFTVEDFRAILNIPKGKLKRFADMNKYAIKPAIEELNHYTDFSVTIEPIEFGPRRKVLSVCLFWMMKSKGLKEEARAELDKHSAGRRARLKDNVEEVVFS